MRVLFLILMILSSPLLKASGPNQKLGQKLYEANCASCHHKDRIGFSAPPLLFEALEKISDEKLTKTISNGLPNTLMQGFPNLSQEEIKELINYIRAPKKINWNSSNIKKSYIKNPEKLEKIEYNKLHDLTAVVERGNSSIWLMEKDRIYSKFQFADVHGGIKYNRKYTKFFVPSRDGYVGKFDLDKGYIGKIRACINLRNITVSNDDLYVVATCLLPSQMVVLNQKDLSVKKILPLAGKISGLYTLINDNKGIFTFRDKSEVGLLDFSNLKLEMIKISESIEDFFIDPLDKYLISSSRGGEKTSVFDLEKRKFVFEHQIPGMPHLSSGTMWYDRGNFYFASFHIKSNFISIWKMYDWSFVKKIEVGGNGFFVRSHPSAQHLWIDNGSDELVLVDKRTLEISKLKPMPGKKFTHTEFSSDGKIAYLSLFDKAGSLILYDTKELKEITRFDASLPVGKYNIVNKEREFLPRLLGQSVFMNKCWGCHHQESVAFGPSFSTIAKKRSREMVRTHLDDPTINAINLGYEKATMPKIPLTEEEKEMLADYVMSFKYDVDHKDSSGKLMPIKLYNMEEHSLDHPYRKVKNCEEYKTWSKLGFKAFSDEEKAEEEKYKVKCEK